MNAEIQALWAADLRAHSELQGKNFLQTPDGKFCCLGRLCELAVQAGVIPPPHRLLFGDEGWRYGYGAGFESQVLPDEVRIWAGLPDCNPNIPGGDSVFPNQTFASVNDSGATFDQIADYIEYIK